MRLFILFIIFINFIYNITLSATEIAVTFDDLPSQEGRISAKNQLMINKNIIQALKKYNAPSTGFVNEGKLFHKKRYNSPEQMASILQLWVHNNLDLANHTYSHRYYSNTSYDFYKNDIIKGAEISQQLMQHAGKPYCFFRFPYLDAGNTNYKRTAMENFLHSQNYIIAPVTIDTNDWRFNARLLRTSKYHNKNIIKKYLAHTKRKLKYYKNKIPDENPNKKHIWLLHVNTINGYVIDELLAMADELGYKFISLSDALGQNCQS